MFQQIQAHIQPLLQQVNSIYQHPLHYTYILHKNDGFLYLYDMATMDVLGRTKVIVLEQMKLFAFTHDFNMIFGLRQSRFVYFELTSSQWLTHQPIETSHQHKPYFEAHYLSFYSKKQILICVTSTNFYLVNPNMGSAYKAAPQLKYQDTQIFPQKVAQISSHVWVVGYRNYIYFTKFSQNYQSYEIFGRLGTGNIVRLSAQHHPSKEFIYVINEQNQVFLIRVNQIQKKLELCYKFFNQNYVPLYLTLLRLGINTSTTDKLRDRMYLNVYCQEKVHEKIVQEQQDFLMVDEKFQTQKQQQPQKKLSLIIIPTDTQYPTDFQSQQLQSQKQFSLKIHNQTFIIRNMPPLKASPWINVFTQNCLLFLTTKNQVSYINFCSIPEMNLKTDQWICMGYKFEMLQKNQVYEEREDQFEEAHQKEQKPLTKEFLDDWSQSNMSKNMILNKTFNRMRSIDI